MPFEYLSAGAQQIVKPGMTPTQQAQTLQKQQLSTDAVKSLAHGMPENKSVQWATASADKVSNPAHPTDYQAVQSAKNWCQNPTPQNQQLAGQAASNAGHKTPGAWAAQAAASAGSGTSLTPHAASGAVLLAAAQGGKPISPSGISTPQAQSPTTPQTSQPTASRSMFSFLKKPSTSSPQTSEQPTTGPDGLTLTSSQRTQMAQNTEPFLQLGYKIAGT